jgi:hypothetical protein
MKKIQSFLYLVLLALISSNCTKPTESDTPNPLIGRPSTRMANFAPNFRAVPVDGYINGVNLNGRPTAGFDSISYLQITRYLNQANGAVDVRFFRATDTVLSSPLLSTSISPTRDLPQYTVAIVDSFPNVSAFVVQDTVIDRSDPFFRNGGYVRVAHLSLNAPPVSAVIRAIALTAPDSIGTIPVLSYKNVSGYARLNASAASIQVLNGTTPVLTAPFTIGAGTVQTIYIRGLVGATPALGITAVQENIP